MTTGRRPTFDRDALADTLDEAHEFALTPAMEDELAHPHRTAQGSRPLPPHDKTPSGRIKPAGVPDHEP